MFVETHSLGKRYGTFDALRLILTPRPAAGTPASARFQGLFGLCGEITLLVDKATKIPLIIRGTVPIGIDVNVEVLLTKIDAPEPEEAEPEAATAPPPTSRRRSR